MKIDITKFQNLWCKDSDGNIINYEGHPDNIDFKPNKYYTLHRCFPLQVIEEVDTYNINPETGNRERANTCILTNSLCHLSGECAVAMVNSGDYTLEQALWIMANACERCSNALTYKYLNGKYGYPEDSDKYRNCNTECEFCKEHE